MLSSGLACSCLLLLCVCVFAYRVLLQTTYRKLQALVNTGISKPCYLAVAESICNECDARSLDFRRWDASTNRTTVYMCHSTCVAFFSTCSAEAAASNITSAEQWCAQWPTVFGLHDPLATRPRPPIYVMSKYDRRCFYGIGYQSGFVNVAREIGQCLPGPGNASHPFRLGPAKPTPLPPPPMLSPNERINNLNPFVTISDFIARTKYSVPSLVVGHSKNTNAAVALSAPWSLLLAVTTLLVAAIVRVA